MTHYHLTGWNMPALSDGDVIRESNLTGWVAPTDITIHVEHSILLGNKEDFPSNIIFAPDVIFVKPDTSEPEPITNPKLSAKAVLVINALIGSGQLDANMVSAIAPLVPAVNSVAGTEVELGVAATEEVIELISELRTINTDNSLQLASQIEQALQAVQAIWEAK